ncbi:MAG TPA: glycosyltransferase [Candidatus Paceibacterota bacterium]
MYIIQVYNQFNFGGTENMVLFFDRYFNQSGHKLITWLLYDGKQPSYLKCIIGQEAIYSVALPECFLVHGGLLSTDFYKINKLFPNIPIFEILHRAITINPIDGIHYIAVSKYVKSLQKGRECDVIYNPVQISDNSNQCNKDEIKKLIGLPDNSFVICRHCRWVTEKNFSDFIYICNTILNNNKRTFICLIGNQQRNDIVTKILSSWAQYNERIKLFNWTNTPEEILKCGDLYLETSKNEAFSLSLCEAAKLRIPIIALESKWVFDVLDNNLFIHKHRDKIIDEILKLIDNSEMLFKHVEAAYNYVEKNYSVRSVYDNYMSTFRKFL